MSARKGEKLGWTGGMLGGFLWVAILSVVLLVQGRVMPGLAGLSLTVAAVLAVVFLAPWRHPSTVYPKLMLGPIVLFMVSIAWAAWAFGGLSKLSLSWWNLPLGLLILLPFITLRKRRWTDGEK